MRPISIPEGVIVQKGRVKDQGVQKNFGVSWILQGMIQDQPLRAAKEKYVPGLVVSYAGDDYQAYIRTRNISPDTINTIGNLSREIEELALIHGFLLQEIKRTEETIKALEKFNLRFPNAFRNMKFDPGAKLEELGIFIQQLRSSDKDNQTSWDKKLLELDSLNVTMLQTKGGAFGALPVQIMANKLKTGKIQQ